MCEVQFHTSPIGPLLECAGGELCAVIDRDRQWCSCVFGDPVQGRDDVAAAKPKPRLYQRRQTTKLIDHGEHAKGPTVEQLIMH